MHVQQRLRLCVGRQRCFRNAQAGSAFGGFTIWLPWHYARISARWHGLYKTLAHPLPPCDPGVRRTGAKWRGRCICAGEALQKYISGSIFRLCVCVCVCVCVFVATNWQTLCIITTKEIISMKIQGMFGNLRRCFDQPKSEIAWIINDNTLSAV